MLLYSGSGGDYRAMARLTLTLLGGFRAQLGTGASLSLPSKKSQALLAYLGMRQARRTSRDSLAVLLWGDTGEEQARQSLRQALAGLRRVLPKTKPVIVAADHQAIALNAAATDVDVIRFERLASQTRSEALQEAVVLFRGDLLEGLRLKEPRFEEWLRAERERIRGRAAAALEQLSARRLGAEAIDASTEAGLRLLALDSTQEAVHRALMRLYLQRGRAAAAVRQYRLCAEILQRELGVQPAPDTEAVHRQACLPRVSPEATPASPVRRMRPSHRPPSERFVGRMAEFGELKRAFEDARKGHGRVVMVSGEAGIGKSRLIEEFAAWAEEREALTVVGRCFEGEQILPFAPWASMLRSESLRAPLREVTEADERWRRELARLLPELGPRASEPPIVQGEYVRIFEAMARVVEAAAARHPLLLILEDLHWADEMSVRLLAFIGRRCGSWRVLVVASVRDEELVDRAASRRVLAEVAGESHVVPVKLPPLSESETLDLVKTLTTSAGPRKGSAGLAGRIWRLSEGNPFMVVETIRTLQEGTGPKGEDQLPLAQRIRQLIMRRIDRLSARGRKLAAVAAVIGGEFEAALLQRAAGLTERSVADGVEELFRHRVLHGVGETLGFTHDRIREVAYDALLVPRRRLIHGAVARALETLHSENLEPHWAALGAHYLAGARWAEAAKYLRLAAGVAAGRGAHREAVACLDQALAALGHLPQNRAVREEGVDLRFELGTCLHRLGQFDRILTCLTEAERAAAALDDRRRIGWATVHLANHLWMTGHPEDARAAAERALAAGEELGDVPLTAVAMLSLGATHFQLSDLRRSAEHLEKAALLLPGELARQRFGLPACPAVASRSWLAMVCADSGEFDRGLRYGEEAVRLAEAIDEPYSLALACRQLGYLYASRGDFGDAAHLLERGLALAHDYRITIMIPVAKAVLGLVYIVSGRTCEGLALLDQSLTLYEASASYHAWASLLHARGYFYAQRIADAAPFAHRALTLAREGTQRVTEAAALLVLGHIAASSESDGFAAAATYYRQALPLASDLGMRPLVAACHLGLGRLHRRTGEHTLAQEHLTVAKTMYDDMTMRFWVAQAETELARKD